MVMRTIPFTKDGFEKIKNEQIKLKESRKLAVEDLSKARAMGDLSENGYYKAARFKLNDIDRRLRELTYQLRFGKVVEKTVSEIIGIGSNVVLKTNDGQITYCVVGEYEADPLSFKISNTSPLGKLLIGKREGNKITLYAPKGSVEYVILKVL